MNDGSGAAALGDAADRLILDEAAGLLGGAPPGTVVVIDDVDGALTVGALRAGARTVRVHQDLITGERSLAERAGSAGDTALLTSPEFTSLPLGRELLDGARVVLLRLPRSLDRLAEVAQLIAAHSAPEVRVVAGGRIKHMSVTMNDVLREVFERVDVSHARQKSRVLTASGPHSERSRELLTQWPHTRRHGDLGTGDAGLTVAAHGGVFAGTGIDIGTRFLLAHLDQAPSVGHAVDLACGSGVIAAWLALRDKQIRVDACDRSAAAVRSARATAEANGVGDRVTVHRADGLEQFPDGSQALILLNPPFHDDAAVTTHIARTLFDDAARALAPGGRLWCVWNSHLRYRSALERHVGPTAQIARNAKFTVTASTRA
ncbi:class I SAM-dependent methyltransferase [Gordonia sp. VNK21]|uniref:class I SAM-dependent methyltransferase n=1 Tax=Gordonia sp. VNK21 TaxID=3382483 RepID=UPI0038D36FCD